MSKNQLSIGNKKLTYNSPVILTYAIFSLAVLIASWLTGGFLMNFLFVCPGHPSFLNPLTYPRLLLHIFGHSSLQHYTNNMIMMLLVGPIVEERYGSWNLTIMILITGIGTGLLNALFFSTGIIGASGIVFMLIILSAFTNMRKGEIPITLVLVTVVYLGQEIYDGFTAHDNISHFGHLIGGLFGLMFGIYFFKKKFENRA